MMAKDHFKKWMVVLVNLDPTIGAEIKKTRPCLIISPDEANRNLLTVIVAPMTSTVRHIPTRLPVQFDGVAGEICFDQMKAIDARRIVKILGEIDQASRPLVTRSLMTLFDDVS
ncbi:MAG TPA: type II toxin-antitoxin system PemK/MazF family toxin [Phnomibacter sp.]|nr:type II toxin-antitoxin system PemK/MazF family toxin [Phnomibacter sp.]